MKIFIGLSDLHAGPNPTGFFSSVTSVTKFGAYLVILTQSANLVKVRAAIARMQKYCKAHMTQNDFYFEKNWCR